MLDSQKVLLQLLKEIDSICNTHGITYYLIGGSALGAVRHHGFIPWDDDADIVMTHDNYKKFIDIMRFIELPPNRDYSDPFLPPYNHTNIFGRYSSTDTTCIFDGVAYQDDNCNGIKVDVFQLLPCPEDRDELDSYLKNFRRWSELCHPTARNKLADPDEYWELSKQGNESGIGELRLKLFNELHVERYESSNLFLYGYEKFHYFYHKNFFGTPKYYPFESLTLPVPTKYQEHFRILFGDDWYCIPDGDKQITHNTTQDVNRSYTYYTKDYLTYKQDSDFICRQRYKYSVLKYWQTQRRVDGYNAVMRAAILKRKYQLIWERQRNFIKAAFDEARFDEVLDLLGEYVQEQTNSLARAASMFIYVDSEMCALVCLALLHTSRISEARFILSIAPGGKQHTLPDGMRNTAILDDKAAAALTLNYYSTDDLGKPRKLLDVIDELTYALERNEFDNQCYNRIIDCLKVYPHNRGLQFFRVLWYTRNYPSFESFEERNAIDSIFEQRADDGDFQKIKGDLELAYGNRQHAIKLYEMCQSNTNNGLIILSARESLNRLATEYEVN